MGYVCSDWFGMVCLVLCLSVVCLVAVWVRSWLLGVGVGCEGCGCGFSSLVVWDWGLGFGFVGCRFGGVCGVVGLWVAGCFRIACGLFLILVTL